MQKIKKNLKKFINIKTYSIFKILLFLVLDIKNFKLYFFILKNIKESYSQIFQDLFVIFTLKKMKNGYFVEVGGGDGEYLSNSIYLEKKYSWTGLICEPSKKNLYKFKKRKCILIPYPVDDTCGKKVKFYENKDSYLSGINKITNYKHYELETLCLNHILKKNCEKKVIDYLSIDTEGNEFEIIKNLNFDNFQISIISIEHNFNKINRSKIKILLEKNNFIRVFKNISYMDDWYINKNLENHLL